MKPANIRVVFAPTPAAFPYIEALEPLGIQIVAMGPLVLNLPPWDRVAMLTVRRLAERYINVVVATEHTLMHPPITFDEGDPESSTVHPGTMFAAGWSPDAVSNVAVAMASSPRLEIEPVIGEKYDSFIPDGVSCGFVHDQIRHEKEKLLRP